MHITEVINIINVKLLIMYKIEPYDLSKSFKYLPEKKKYAITFFSGCRVEFTNKRKAFDFISKVSFLFIEQIAICEMVNNTIHSFSFHIKPNSPSNKDIYNIYHNNYTDILKLLADLKFYQYSKIEMYQLVMCIDKLISLIIENCNILNSKNNNCVIPYSIILQKSSKSLKKCLNNAELFYNNKNLTLFSI